MAWPKKQSIADRLFSQTKPSNNGCIEWTGWTVFGYGRMRLGEKRIAVHRLAYELKHGSIPDGLCVCHKCDNRRCVNVDHLFLGTRTENNADKVAKGRQAQGPLHGRRGESHPMAKINTADVVQIRSRYAKGEKQRDLAKEFNVSQTSISLIVRNLIWRT